MNLKDSLEKEWQDAPTGYNERDACNWANGYNQAVDELLSRLEAGEKAIEELEKYKMICLRQKRIWKLEE